MPSSTHRPAAGDHFNDFELPDHSGNRRRLSELVGGDLAILQFYRPSPTERGVQRYAGAPWPWDHF